VTRKNREKKKRKSVAKWEQTSRKTKDQRNVAKQNRKSQKKEVPEMNVKKTSGIGRHIREELREGKPGGEKTKADKAGRGERRGRLKGRGGKVDKQRGKREDMKRGRRWEEMRVEGPGWVGEEGHLQKPELFAFKGDVLH